MANKPPQEPRVMSPDKAKYALSKLFAEGGQTLVESSREVFELAATAGLISRDVAQTAAQFAGGLVGVGAVLGLGATLSENRQRLADVAAGVAGALGHDKGAIRGRIQSIMAVLDGVAEGALAERAANVANAIEAHQAQAR